MRPRLIASIVAISLLATCIAVGAIVMGVKGLLLAASSIEPLGDPIDDPDPLPDRPNDIYGGGAGLLGDPIDDPDPLPDRPS